MDTLEDTQSSLGVCCCCLAEGSYKDMMRPYTWIGQDEIYSTMLMDCFGIDITSLEVAPWLDSKRLICELCIARLREASSFKTQVEQAQKTYVDRLKTFNFRDITKPELMAPVKLERLDDSEVDNYELADDFAGEDDMSDIMPAVTSREEARRHHAGPPKDTISTKTKKKMAGTKLLNLSNICPFRVFKNKFLCMLCHHMFADVGALREHMDTHDSVSQKYLTQRIPHLEPMKVDITDLQCKICRDNIRDYVHLKEHLSKEHNEVIENDFVLPFRLDDSPYTCLMCSEEFYVFSLLNQHMNKHFQNFICSTCGKGFMTEMRLKSHLKIHITAEYACSRCHKIFNTMGERAKHIASVHRKGVRYACPHCSECFTEYHLRLKHISQIHKVKIPVYNCNVCGRGFARSANRSSHMRSVHLGEKNYACTECGAAFFSAELLRNHEVKHSGERKFQCDVCHKAYARIKTLREHMRIHNNDRRFVCPVCKKAFVQKCSLKAHLRVHHPDY